MDEEEPGFLNRPIEVSVKPWQVLAALGAGGFILYLILKKKDEPIDAAAPAQPALPVQPASPPQSKPAGATGTSGFVLLGEQDEPLYEGHPLVGSAREYTQNGWTVFKVPTGHENVMKNRQRFDVQAVYAAPPGHRIPRRAERVEL
jgi:hypothetical protein